MEYVNRRRLLYESESKKRRASGSASSAAAKSAGTSRMRSSVSSSRVRSTSWPAATPAPRRFSLLTPSQYSPPMTATVLRQV